MAEKNNHQLDPENIKITEGKSTTEPSREKVRQSRSESHVHTGEVNNDHISKDVAKSMFVPSGKKDGNKNSSGIPAWILLLCMVGMLIVGLLVGTKLGQKLNAITPNLSVQDTNSKAFKLKDTKTPDFSFLSSDNEVKGLKSGNVIGNSFYIVDNQSGVEYIVTNKGGITPRLNHKGQPMIANTK